MTRASQATASGLALIVLVFVVLALAYARATPYWQSPDEPAHFNYVKYVAETGQLPVLQAGDYPAGVVPVGPRAHPVDISAFRYESHQPPLFYALGALVYKLRPTTMALRLLSILFGAALLPVAYWCVRLAFPARPWLGFAVAAFMAFIPMQLFIAGSVENDTLSELVLSALLLAYLAIVAGWESRWRWLVVGGLFGLALLTKTTIYLPAVLLALAALLWRGRTVAAAGTTLAAAVAVAGWWFVRNGLIYGWNDILVQGRQEQVAGSQVQTGVFGSAELVRFVTVSFRSFWGQFGWMSVPLPDRYYQVLGLLTLAAILGLVALALRRHWPGTTFAWLGLALVLIGVVAGDLAYNLKFVQPQGRYLFPALVPIATVYILGISGLAPRRHAPVAVMTLCLLLALFAAFTLRHDLIPNLG